MRNILGPNDVKAGDRVEHRNHQRGGSELATVVRAGPERLTVRYDNGRSRSVGYIKTWRTTGQIINETRSESVFRLLSAHDVWQQHERPRSTLDGEFWERMRSAVATGTLAEIHAEIDAIAAWLAAEPPREP